MEQPWPEIWEITVAAAHAGTLGGPLSFLGLSGCIYKASTLDLWA